MAERKLEKNNSKKVVQDIFPTGRRSIRNIAMTQKDAERSGRKDHDEVVSSLIRRKELKADAEKKSSRREYTEKLEKESVKEALKVHHHIQEKRSSKKRLFSNTLVTFSVVFIGVVIIAIALSLLYSKAVVTITPKITHFEVDQKITSKRIVSLKELPYEIIAATSTQSKEIDAIKGQLVSTKAKGSVTFYNQNSTTSQKIIAGTKLSSEKGLVYRTLSTIIIPGTKMSQGKVVPGTISVSAVADVAGASYNTSGGVGDMLKIVAYKGSPKYNTIYAKIKTDFAGGFLGNTLTTDPKAEKEAIESLKTSLKAVLDERIKNEVTSNYVLYPGFTYINYTKLPNDASKNSSASSSKNTTQIVVEGVIKAVVFKSDTLFKYIAQDEVEKFPSNTYVIKGLENLSVTIANPKDFSPNKSNTLMLSIKGPLTMIGTFVEENLRSELRGKKLGESNSIFAKYPAISNAYALITPFWMRSFPNSEEKIILNIKSE